MRKGSLIPIKYFRRNRAGQIEAAHEVEIESLERRAGDGSHVERQIGRAAPFAEQAFLGNPRLPHRGTDANPDSTSVPHRWIARRLNRYDRHLTAVQHPRLHRHRWQRQDIALPVNIRKPRQQLVVDRQRRP